MADGVVHGNKARDRGLITFEIPDSSFKFQNTTVITIITISQHSMLTVAQFVEQQTSSAAAATGQDKSIIPNNGMGEDLSKEIRNR